MSKEKTSSKPTLKVTDRKVMVSAIKALRVTNNLSQKAMAEIGGMTAQNYHNFETNKVNHKLTLDQAYLYSRYFKMPIEAVIGVAKYTDSEKENIVAENDSLKKRVSDLEDMVSILKKSVAMADELKEKNDLLKSMKKS
jgi:DNA-binding XRE family transcriptional regulator